MGILKKLAKSGMFGLAGMAATNKGVLNKIARNGGFGLAGMAATNKGALNKIARNGGFGAAGMLAAKKHREENPRMDASEINSPRMQPIRITDVEETEDTMVPAMRRGGKVKKKAKGGSVSSASKRADGCAIKGKTKGRMV